MRKDAYKTKTHTKNNVEVLEKKTKSLVLQRNDRKTTHQKKLQKQNYYYDEKV